MTRWCVFRSVDGRTAVKSDEIEALVECGQDRCSVVTSSDTYRIEVPFDEAIRTIMASQEAEA